MGVAIVVLSVVVALVVAHRRGWRWNRHCVQAALDRLRTMRFRSTEPVVDEEFLDRRRELLSRIARAVIALPEFAARESHHVVVHVHPTDTDLVGRDVIGDERDLRRLITSHGRTTRIIVRHVCPDPNIPRGRAHVVLAEPIPGIAGTRTFDEGPADVPHVQSATTAPRHAQLVHIGRSAAALAIPPSGGVVGRDATLCQVVVDAPTVSRQHAYLRPRSNGFVVEDLDSANGTTINSRSTELGLLRHGDILGLGRTIRLRLEVLSS